MMKKIFEWTKVVVVLLLTINVFAIVFGCHNGTKDCSNVLSSVSKSLYDSEVARCDRQDSNNEITFHRLYAIDSELVVDNKIWEDSVKALRKTLFLAEFRLTRIDYHLKLIVAHPAKFEKDLQGWVDRDAHYELNLDDGSIYRKLLLPQAKKDIDLEISDK